MIPRRLYAFRRRLSAKRLKSLASFPCPLCGGRAREIERWSTRHDVDQPVRAGFKYACESCGYEAVWDINGVSPHEVPAQLRRFEKRAPVNGGHAHGVPLAWYPGPQYMVTAVDGVRVNLLPAVVRGRLAWRRKTIDPKIPVLRSAYYFRRSSSYYFCLSDALAATVEEDLAVAVIEADPPRIIPVRLRRAARAVPGCNFSAPLSPLSAIAETFQAGSREQAA